MLFVVFHVLLAGADLLVLRFLSRRRHAVGLAQAAAASLAAMLLLAYAGSFFGLSEERYFGSLFTFFGLLNWGLFLHGPILLAVAAGLLRAERRGLAHACAVLAALLLVVIADATLVEPARFDIERYEIESAKRTERLRIVLIADLQTDDVGEYERRVLAAAAAEKPDLVLFSGDYVQVTSEDYEEEAAALGALLRESGLTAPLGLFAVEGNVDRPPWPAIFDGTGATTFVETGSTDVDATLRVTGLAFHDSFRTDLFIEESTAFHVVLGHAPDYALGEIEADLLVAGHTHGGQVRVPFFGPLLTLSAVPRSWASGLTRISTKSVLVVSRGLGMERGDAPRVRFFCAPELTVIDVLPSSDG